jgi:CHAD domain-containing protein
MGPAGLALEAAAAALAAAVPVRQGRNRAREQSFYDTFDGLVRAAGLAVVHEDGHLAVVERASGRVCAREALRRPARPLAIGQIPRGALHEALAPVLGPRALLARARVLMRELDVDVLDDEAKTVTRVAVVAPALLGPDGATTLMCPRLRLTAVRGYDAELETVCAELMAGLELTPAEQPLVDEAINAAGWPPDGVSSKVTVELARGERTDAAASAVLGRLACVIEANLDGTLADIDPEFLHDLRVAVRRSRALQRELSGAFAPAGLAHYRAEFRWLQQVTGELRDLDIHLLEFDEYRALVGADFTSGLVAVREVLQRRRRRALLAMRRALRSERFTALRTQWPAYLHALPGAPVIERPDAQTPIEAVAGRRIRRLYRRMLQQGNAIGETSPAEALHELRKQGKELRYMLELFGGLYPAEVVKPLIRSLKELQDLLGRHHDRSVQVTMLRSLLDEVAARPDGVGALVAIGALSQRLLDDERAARDAFAERFAGFAVRDQRQAVKEAFR